MTIATTHNRKTYTGDGATVAFQYDYLILDATHMEVYLDGVLQVAGYSVSNVGVVTGGNVTFSSAPASGVQVVLLRNVPLTQITDYVENTKFPADTHEKALDKITMFAQQIWDYLNQTLHIPRKGSDKTEAVFEITDVAADRASKVVGFDASGDVSLYPSGESALTGVYTTTFVNADLTAGVLILNDKVSTHVAVVVVWDDSGKMVIPDEVTSAAVADISVDLSSFGTLTGTWRVLLLAVS